MNNNGIPSERLTALARYSGDPWTPDNPYFAVAEKVMDGLWDNLVFPFIKNVDFSTSLDLGAGHGRNSKKLLSRARNLFIADIQHGNLEVCKARFFNFSNITYIHLSGYDFSGIDEDAITFIYCFDAMVHFDSDVIRSYLADTRRVLKPGGMAFYHHSNYTGGSDWRQNPESRNFMSREFFAHYAHKEGLRVVDQKLINWGHTVNLDCLTLVQNPILDVMS